MLSLFQHKAVVDPSAVTLVLYHGHCPDGLGAAWAAWKRLGDQARYVACDHGGDVPDVTGAVVVILDFSFKRDVLRHMVETARQLLVIDHHASALEELKELPAENQAFDLGHSGAILAWHFFHRDRMPPQFLFYVEDRDLWTWRLKDAREICAGLDTVDPSFAAWDALDAPGALQLLKARGEPLLAFRKALVDGIMANSEENVLDGYVCRVVNVNAPQLISQVGDALLSKYKVPIALLWYVDHKAQQYKVSLRSGPGVDCSVLAVEWGGGGHPQACGFTVKRTSPRYEYFVDRIIHLDVPRISV